jgi:hypothetical protein
MRPESQVGVGPGGSRVGAEPAITPPSCGRDRRLLLEQFRPVALHLEIAELLERRAGLSDNRVLADLLEERAAGHRQAADRMRCSLGPAARADDGHREAVGQV